MPGRSTLSICTSCSSRQSLKAWFYFKQQMWVFKVKIWPVFGAVKVRLGLCPLISFHAPHLGGIPSSLGFTYCPESEDFQICISGPKLSPFCSSQQWGHESLIPELVPMVPSNLDNPQSLQTGMWSFSLRSVVLSKCYHLSRGKGQKRKEKPDCISDSGGRSLDVAVPDFGWNFSCAGSWAPAVFTWNSPHHFLPFHWGLQPLGQWCWSYSIKPPAPTGIIQPQVSVPKVESLFLVTIWRSAVQW